MRNRKRHTAQPMLEAMEPRVAPSVTAVHIHHERVVAAHIAQSSARQERPRRASDRITRRCETCSSKSKLFMTTLWSDAFGHTHSSRTAGDPGLQHLQIVGGRALSPPRIALWIGRFRQRS